MFSQPLSQQLGWRARLSRVAVFLSYIVTLVCVAARTAIALPLSNAEGQRIIDNSRRAQQVAESLTSTKQGSVVVTTIGAIGALPALLSMTDIEELQEEFTAVNKEIEQLSEQKQLFDLMMTKFDDTDRNSALRDLLEMKEDNMKENFQKLLIKRTSITSQIANIIKAEMKQNKTDNERQNIFLSQSNSRMICQIFVFGTIFGVVCTISACTWSFSKSDENTNDLSLASRYNSSISRLTQTPEPFDSTKPYCIKVDEKGLCYASPLSSEVPPLPGYNEALQMSRNIMTFFNKTRENVPDTSSNESSPQTTIMRNSLVKE